MKCSNCKAGEYQRTGEIYKENGVKLERYICSNCDDEKFLQLKNNKRKIYRLKHKLQEAVGYLIAAMITWGFIWEIFTHHATYFTTMR